MQDLKLYKTGRLKDYFRKKNSAAAGTLMFKTLCHPCFPLYYILRNLNWLQREKWWKALSPRSKKVRAAILIRERIAIFREVKEWKKGRNELQPLPNGNGATVEAAPSYCNKCGLCCEVASGMPDFPDSSRLCARWRSIFANGLGRGHRFCSFLWEDEGPGGSFCSVYSWRSNPCRLFDSEECDWLREHPEPAEISSDKNLLLMRRWLASLINGRKLPLPGANITRKSPELLELDRV